MAVTSSNITGETDDVSLRNLIAQVRDATAVLAIEAAELKMAAVRAELATRCARLDRGLGT